ncbi:MAG TPA: penicillin-binding protein 2 [Chloroflexota bacterium]|jgi:penicillin-binding protein 2|nr:penicillin-binding protein 2 [Chloroflexota bacterium]
MRTGGIARGGNGRIWLARLALLAAFVALGVQTWRLQVAEGGAYREQADYNRMRVSPIAPLRGVIYDRHGELLATNAPSFVVSVVPADLPRDQEAQVLKRLAEILEIDEAVVADALERARAAGEAFTPVVVRRNIDLLAVQRLQEQQARLPGVVVQSEPVREYPDGAVFAHLIGYVGPISAEEYEAERRRCAELAADQRRKECYGPNDRLGVMGLERQYERALRGVPGQRLSEVDAAGRVVRELREEPPEPGLNLVLNIDAELQRAVERFLEEGLHGSPSGAAIVMRPGTGEVLAMVSLPNFDNNLFAADTRDDRVLALLNDPQRPLFHRAIAGQYPPGSTFKLVTGAAALHEGIATRNTVIEGRGAIFVPNEYDPRIVQRFPDWASFGPMNFIQGLAYSSDVYFYYLGGGFESFRGLGNELLARYAQQFGFGARTGIDLPDEAEGLVPTASWKYDTFGEPWVLGDTYNMAIGQGFITATPLQVATATNAFANGGILYRPLVAHALVDQDGRTVREFAPQVIRRLPLSEADWQVLRDAMEAGYTISPLLRHLRIPGLRVAGKTGTAEFYGRRNERGELPTHGWYTGFAPVDKPEIAVTVFVELGSGTNEAAPIATRIFRKYFGLPDVPLPPAPPATFGPPAQAPAAAPAAGPSPRPAASAAPAAAAPRGASPATAPTPQVPATVPAAPAAPAAAPRAAPAATPLVPRAAIPTLGPPPRNAAPAAP